MNQSHTRNSMWHKAGVAMTLALVVAVTALAPQISKAAPPNPPANPAIAYVGLANGSYSICVMNADGARKTPILSSPSGGGAFSSLSWSPNGGSICFNIIGRLTNGGVLYTGLAAIDVSIVNGNPVSSNFRMLVSDPSHVAKGAWSPDGTTIAYMTGSAEGIWTVPAAGGTPTQIYSGGWVNSQPAWSPDGSQLAFVQSEGGGIYSVRTLDLAMGTTTTICQLSPNYVSARIDWSRTNLNSIVFDLGLNGVWEVFVVPAVSSSIPQRLSTKAWMPTWSPDDTRVAYSGGNSGDTIYVKNRLTGVVTSTGAKGKHANWRR